MKHANKRVSFEELTYEEKKEAIYYHIFSVSSQEYVNELIDNNILEIKDCVKYKNSIGCPVVKYNGRTFREINKKFPLLEIKGIVKNLYNNKILNESCEE